MIKTIKPKPYYVVELVYYQISKRGKSKAVHTYHLCNTLKGAQILFNHPYKAYTSVAIYRYEAAKLLDEEYCKHKLKDYQCTKCGEFFK